MGWEGPVTGASNVGGSSAGVSCGGAVAIPILGLLGPTTGPFSPPVRLLLGLAWLRLRPPGQWCPDQMGALLDLASLDKQPVEVAPSFYPEGELWEAIKAEASSLLELLGDICHVVHRGLLLNSDCLSLPGSEVVKEAFPHPSPLSLPEGSL